MVDLHTDQREGLMQILRTAISGWMFPRVRHGPAETHFDLIQMWNIEW